MTLAEARAALRSSARSVVIEAPAGTGKTFEAVEYALDAAATLPPRREVLLLAHTNAAVDEFRRRSRAAKAAVRATTFDSFATEIVAAYAKALGLPHPLRPQPEGSKIPGSTPFSRLVPTLVDLLDRAPSIAAAIAGHYPILICDEHQDASEDQQRIVEKLTSHGALVRYFGDPMQAIYDFKEQILVDWEVLSRSAEGRSELNEPQRWKNAPELGTWLLSSHRALRANGVVPIPPNCVAIYRVPDLKDKALANPKRDRPFIEIKEALRKALAGKTGSIAILARSGAHRRGVQSLQWSFEVFEGSDMQQSHEAVYAAAEAGTDSRALVVTAIDFLSDCCTGFSATLVGQLGRACGPEGITRGRISKDAAPILDRLRPLYDEPSLGTWARVVGGFLRPPPGIRPVMVGSLRAIARLGRGSATYERFAEQMADVRLAAALPTRAAYTIHMAKGREFDHVVLVHCGAAQFPDEPSARRLLYVALSRARRTVNILTPQDEPSPLLGLSSQ